MSVCHYPSALVHSKGYSIVVTAHAVITGTSLFKRYITVIDHTIASRACVPYILPSARGVGQSHPRYSHAQMFSSGPEFNICSYRSVSKTNALT